jgi:SSS family solute:Na+ symporter
VAALGTYLLHKTGVAAFKSDLEESFWGAGIAFVTVAVVAAILTPMTSPKPADELNGLVYGTAIGVEKGGLFSGDVPWYRSPELLGAIAVVLSILLYIPFF